LDPALFDILSLREKSLAFAKKKPCESIDENVIEPYHQARNQLGTPGERRVF